MLLFYKKIIMVKHELKTNGKFSQINAQVKLNKKNEKTSSGRNAKKTGVRRGR